MRNRFREFEVTIVNGERTVSEEDFQRVRSWRSFENPFLIACRCFDGPVPAVSAGLAWRIGWNCMGMHGID